MKLSNGQTYRTLLENYYPPLRRTDYTIAYNVRAFSVEEAKEVIRTNPKLLSLNEMYLVAQTYPENSKEFKEVFDIATRLYPNEPIAILNSAAADIEGGNHQAAIDRLNRIENDPRSWNNLGVGHARMSNPAKAKEYFEKAAARGDADAKANLEELNKTTKD
jgi:tetratricopeptide (TPR) repeat protein